MNTGDPGLVQSDLTLFDIVETLQEVGGAGVTELSERIGMSKGALHKHLKTLERRQYVHNDDGTYRLGLKFLEHGGYVRDTMRVYSLGREPVMDLSESTDEMVVMAVKDHDCGSFVFRSRDKFGLMGSNPVGERFYLHHNAMGKAILSTLPREEVKALIDRTGLPAATEATVTDRDELFDELDDVRERGYAINLGEKSGGIWAVSAPVVDPIQDVVGAISITVPESRTSERRLRGEYSEAVIDTASALSLRLKHDTNL